MGFRYVESGTASSFFISRWKHLFDFLINLIYLLTAVIKNKKNWLLEATELVAALSCCIKFEKNRADSLCRMYSASDGYYK
jgi:hypothetical protein